MVVDRDPSGRLRLRGPERYWSLEYRPNPALTEAECTARIREIIRDAVRIRMFSDVPLGAFLSGGLDSSTVVAAMAQVSARPVETFSIGFDEESFDEMPYAEQVAKKFGANHHTFRCTPDALEVLPTLVHHFDEPFADSSAIPTYYVSRIARQHVTVALSGDGGDEIFAGYTRYDNALQRLEWTRFFPDPLLRAVFRTATRLYPLGFRGWGILNRNSLAPFDSFLAEVSLFQPRERDAVLAARLRPSNGDIFSRGRALARQSGSQDLLSQIQFVDQMLYLPDDILVKVDRASMAVALETRAPLLDYRLAEFMATVPAELRYRNRTKKYLLKQAARGILPSEIIDRGKMGFGVPLKHWFRKEAAGFARDVLTAREARERGLLNQREVAWNLERHAAGRRDFSAKLWSLVFFELWCRKWLDRPVAAGVRP
jgi:asparagine synthase (glutamine-hydrolysing)